MSTLLMVVVVVGVYCVLFLRSVVSPRTGWVGLKFYVLELVSVLLFGRSRTLFTRAVKYGGKRDEPERALIFMRRLMVVFCCMGFVVSHYVLRAWDRHFFEINFIVERGFFTLVAGLVSFAVPFPASARSHFGHRVMGFFEEFWKPASFFAASGCVVMSAGLSALLLGSGDVLFYGCVAGVALFVWLATGIAVLFAARKFTRTAWEYKRRMTMAVARTGATLFLVISLFYRFL